MEFYYDKRKYTLESFAEQYCDGDTDLAKTIIEELFDKGRAINVSKEDKAYKKFQKDIEDLNEYEKVKQINTEEEEEEYARRDKRAEENPTYNAGHFKFFSRKAALQFQKTVQETMKIKESEIKLVDGQYEVIVLNVTTIEAAQLNSIYHAVKMVDTTVRATDKLTETATGILSFAGNNVIAPVAKVGIKGAGKVAKGLFSTLLKVGSGVISTTVDTIKSTANDIKDDPEILKAKVAIKQQIDNVRKFKNNIGMDSSGIYYE